MPIYMDRHYIKNATKNMLHEAHQKDLGIQDKFDVNFLTYWFDEERSTTFCLVEAPDEHSIKTVHDHAHGDIPHEIIEVDPNVVNAFLGRVKDPPAPKGKESDGSEFDSAFRAIMFTDLKDSTATTVRLGDKKAMELLRIHNAMTRNAIKKHNGREVKHTGDGYMISFQDVNNAVECGIEIQNSFQNYNISNSEEDKMLVRIGISAGEPVDEDGDLFGQSVQLAARICAQAAPGGVLISKHVFDLYECAGERPKQAGHVDLKGFSEPVPIFAI